jgi:glycerate 2-kinase
VNGSVANGLRVSGAWMERWDLDALLGERLATLELGSSVAIVAIGKAAREMAAGTERNLMGSVARRFIVCDDESARRDPYDAVVRRGDHPVASDDSIRNGEQLVEFVRSATRDSSVLFLISGGASSLCALPQPPLTLADLRGIWRAALAEGVDITTLNQLRAASSAIAGGKILELVGSTTSASLILVDNAVSGAPWVASALTYWFAPSLEEVRALLATVGLADTELGFRFERASSQRAATMTAPSVTHRNVVVAEPGTLLAAADDDARKLGYRVVSMGAQINGDVADVARQWHETLRRETRSGDRFCLIGVGEVTVRVEGNGLGGRCQAFAATMAQHLRGERREVGFVARATDGRDFLAGVGGAWVDGATWDRGVAGGVDWLEVLRQTNSYVALRTLNQLVDGGHTGWNLCDLYVLCVDGHSAVDR